MLALESGTLIAGRYRLDRPLARGGMGAVWTARHVRLDLRVAIKFITAEWAGSPDAQSRFEREAKVAARIRSPHVIHVYDYGREDGTPFIVMELLEGESLDARLRREGSLGPAATARIVVGVCKALRRAHAAGLVHRDLKPANVFLAQNDDEEVVKVLDFGIVKETGCPLVDGPPTMRGVAMGSLRYMSPEQVSDSSSVDAGSDLWSLAVIAFRCLSGALPFDGADAVSFCGKLFVEPLTPPSQVAPGLGTAADAFFARALSRDRGERFQSAEELAEAFVALAWQDDARRDLEWSVDLPPATRAPSEAAVAP